MKAFLLFLALFSLSIYTTFGQKAYSIKGSVADTSFRIPLQNATITILQSKDSILVGFTRAREDGTFNLSILQKGKYILLVTYSGYADYVDQFILDSTRLEHDFSIINMIQKSKLLSEIIVKAKAAPIKLKGDTTEFNAAAYNIQPNSKVEDLLKQLPGISIDKDGKITAQGQQVKKVLVDGEEFFGDDPTLVTKNIRADMVDKVQVYDKKSDQAAFTGIDDGEKTKTINIKLKADKKNGYFGKLEGGAGTDGYYQSQLLFNRFKAKLKFSVYGTFANTGKIGLGWQDNQKFASSDNITYGDGFISFTNSGDEFESFDGQYNGEGIPTAKTGGFHFDTKWNSDKENLNSNYKLGSISVDGYNNTLNQNNLPGGAINSNSSQNYHRHIFKQKIDGTYSVKIDTNSNIKINADATLKNTETNDQYTTNTSDQNNGLLNTNSRSLINTKKQTIIDFKAFYTKKFRKKGRTFSVNLTQKYDESHSDGYLKSEIDFFNGKTLADSIQTIDQSKIYHTSSFEINTNLTYSEPLSKQLSLIFNYGFGLNQGKSNRQTFNPSGPGNYSILVPGLSNNFELNQNFNLAGISFAYSKDKIQFNWGSKVNQISYREEDLYSSFLLKRNFINLNPSVYFKYKFSNQKNITFNYDGYSQQPSLDQIQPVLINTDPLNISLGNQDLKPSFKHTFQVGFRTNKVLTETYFTVNGTFSIITLPISNSINTNSLTGASTIQYINLIHQKPLTFSSWVYFGKKISGWDLQSGTSFTMEGNINYALSNGLLNTNKSLTYKLQSSVYKSKEKKYDFYLSAGPTYSIGSSSLQPQLNNNGLGWDGSGSFNIYLPAQFQISSDQDFQFRPKTASFNQSFERLIINASITKKFFKNGPLSLVLSGNDLLNQNVGFNRAASNNSLTQTSYNTIRRFFLLSLIWDFNKEGIGEKK